MSKVYLTRFKKSLKLFKEFNNELKGMMFEKYRDHPSKS